MICKLIALFIYTTINYEWMAVCIFTSKTFLGPPGMLQVQQLLKAIYLGWLGIINNILSI